MISEKILEIRKLCDFFQANAKSYKYKYVKGSTILHRIRDKMNELGLLLYPEIITHEIDCKEGEEDSKRICVFNGKGNYVWLDIETGENLSIPWSFVGEQNEISKSFGSALTYSERYFLLKFFNVPTDEQDPDSFENTFKPVDKLHQPKKNALLGFTTLKYNPQQITELCQEVLGVDNVDLCKSKEKLVELFELQTKLYHSERKQEKETKEKGEK